MTDDTVPHQNGVADELAAIAAPAPTLPPSPEEASASPEPPAAVASEIPETPAEPPPPSFDDLGLHPDVKLALDEMGYTLPTPVQTAVYRPVSEGKDLLVQSRTGTGKTTAFGLPTISKIIPTHRAPQALILAPTRELALQVSRELTQLGKHRGILVEPIYGGAPIGKQIHALRDGVHIVVGTPGRVLDHIGRRTLDCSTVQTFILDECDEMLSMGFLEDIERVVSHLPDRRQTLLFSATMPDDVLRYARRHMQSPEQISLSRDGISVNEIHHAYYIVSGIARGRDLLKVIFAEEPESAIIFCNMRDETTMVAKFLQKQGLDAEPLSSDLAQSDRERVMNRMKQHSLRFLCATDVAARGIDISDLSHVINYSVPETPEIYVHRTGRTGRAGKKGTALSLVGPRELGNFRYVRLQFGIKPEERVLPKDDIFVGRLKVPLPPVGTPQPPDPVQILIRGIQLAHGGPTDLEMKIFEKLMVTAAGRKVAAQLVAERLNQLTTRTKPRRPDRERTERIERTEDAVASTAPVAPDDRGERGDRGERRFDRDRGDRPRGDGERRFDRDDRGGERRFDRDRGDRPRGDGERPRGDGDRPRGDGDRPRGDGDRPRGDGDRPRGDGEDRGERRFDRDRGDRPRGDGERRFDRDDRGERRFDRDRGERRFDRDRGDRPRDRVEPAADTTAPAPAGVIPTVEVIEAMGAPAVGAPAVGASVVASPGTPEAGETTARDDRDRYRDRDRHRDRRDRERRFDRDSRDSRDRTEPARHEPRAAEPAATEDAVAVGTEAAPAVEAVIEMLEAAEPVALPVEDTRPAPQRAEHRDRPEHADRGDRKGRRDKRSEPTTETREFWETWADEKSARVGDARPDTHGKAEPPAADPVAEPAAHEPAEAAEGDSSDTAEHRRERGRDRERGRGRADAKGHDRDRHAKPERPDRHAKAEPDKERPARSERPDRHAKTEPEDKAERSTRGKRDTMVTATAAAADGAQARLFVSLGKKHGVSADDLRDLLAGPIGGDKSRIGSVSLRDSHAHVRVPEEHVDAIIAGVHGTQHNEQEVTVERARA